MQIDFLSPIINYSFIKFGEDFLRFISSFIYFILSISSHLLQAQDTFTACLSCILFIFHFRIDCHHMIVKSETSQLSTTQSVSTFLSVT